MDILVDVVQALSKADGGDYRSRFERVVSQRTGFSYVRLADEPTHNSGPSGGMPLSCVVPWAEHHVVLRADSHVRGHLTDPARRRMLKAAAPAAVLVLRLEAAEAAAAKPPVREAEPRPAAPERRLLLGASEAMEELRRRILRVARTDYRVLIEGETGAGKEIVAREIHRLSDRHQRPFVAINCAALVDSLMDAQLFGIEERTATGVRGQRGLFEKAHGGVLFLDEVGELPLQAQAKLLRVLQEDCSERVGGSGPRRIDVRVVAATNRRLESLVELGQFREDLYYRLSAVQVRVPPLREHPEDIVDLAFAHLRVPGASGPTRISSEAMEALMLYEWPGNVRQLERVLEQAVTEGDEQEIRLADLPGVVRERYGVVALPPGVRDDTMRAWRRRYARLVLHRCADNRREACRVLDISYHTLRSYLWDGPGEAETRRKRRAARRAGS
jgi:transcriptional regulator with PAS, ATPase and Fis domain